ncbi:platelet glycoprotein Ib alpha chain [Megalops cyprinoides]|uniref:platelet glycoprotein Ib alpha chain n=1 Tax=Megalops cyprinoides TaxID=118141 RepID=UPI00186404FD|nr:platelet glycoprotein Ib alpha chain [Megalops cyprinoides]
MSIRMRFVLSLLLLSDFCLLMTYSCHSDKDKDHRPRVNCTNMGLNNVPPETDTSTEVLVLTDNQFLSLSWRSYQSFTKLHELDLSRNQVSSLERLPDQVLPSLRVLHLSDNRIQEVPESAFTAASNLMEIYLSRNQLHTVREGSFRGLDSLELVDLSQNHIRVLPHSMSSLMTTTVLKKFDVEDNRLRIMPDQFFSNFPEIPYVFLSKNPWICSCKVGYLSSWLEDQVSNVYMHTGPKSIINDPESIVCDSPSQLKGQIIIDLQRDDYCSPGVIGDMDSTDAVTTELPTSPKSHFVPITTPSALSPSSTALDSIPTTTDVPITHQTSELTQTETVAPYPHPSAIATQDQITTSTTFRSTTPTMSVTTMPTTPVQPQTTAPTQAHTLTPTSSNTITSVTSKSQLMTTARYFYFMTFWVKYHESHATEFATSRTVFKKEVVGEEVESTAIITNSNTFLITATPKAFPLTTTDPLTMVHPPTNVSVNWEERKGERSVVLYCWWLFAGYLCLCILLGLWLCATSLWILRFYLYTYSPLARKACKRRKGQVRLLGYQSAGGSGENDGGGEKGAGGPGAISLPMEGTGGVQAMFRSVLFVYKGGEVEEPEPLHNKNQR